MTQAPNAGAVETLSRTLGPEAEAVSDVYPSIDWGSVLDLLAMMRQRPLPRWW